MRTYLIVKNSTYVWTVWKNRSWSGISFKKYTIGIEITIKAKNKPSSNDSHLYILRYTESLFKYIWKSEGGGYMNAKKWNLSVFLARWI